MGKRSRILVVLGASRRLHAAVLAAGLFAPYGYAEQHRDFPYAAPMKLHLVRDGPSFLGWSRSLTAGYREDPGRTLPGPIARQRAIVRCRRSRSLVSLRAPMASGATCFRACCMERKLSVSDRRSGGDVISGDRVDPRNGRRILRRVDRSIADEDVRILYGLTLALPVAGVRAILPLHVGGLQAFCLVIGIIGAVGWVRPARLIRGVVLSAREREYVLTRARLRRDAHLPDPQACGAAHLGGSSDPSYYFDPAVYNG